MRCALPLLVPGLESSMGEIRPPPQERTVLLAGLEPLPLLLVLKQFVAERCL